MTKEEKEWRLTTNDHYLEVMKSLMSLITASFVLPLFFIKNFVGADRTLKSFPDYYRAYEAWVFLGLALVCGMIFYWASAKYVKVVSGGEEKSFWVRVICHKESVPYNWFETSRDTMAALTIVCFLAGIALALWFFKGL